MEKSEDSRSVVYELGVENELRVVTGEEQTVSIKLLNGFGEIFGFELVLNTVYKFPPYSSISIYSWQGCSIELSGEAVKACVISNSMIMMHVNIHACLEQQRIIAASNFEKGPVSLVVGSSQSGKSAFCRFLLNYAARMGRSPLHIDLDVMKNTSLIPGTISISIVKEPSHIIEGFSKQPSSVYCFGYNHPRKNTLLYYSLLKNIGEIVQEQLGNEKASMYASGVIIDTLSWKRKKSGCKTIPYMVKVFNVDVIFVISSHKLFKNLRRNIPSNVKLVYVPRQKGVIEHTFKELEIIQQSLVRQYFYGTIQNPMTPYVFDVKFSDVKIYSATATGSFRKVDKIKSNILKISFNQELVDCVLGLSTADVIDAELLTKSVKGFICVTGIHMGRGTFTVISPKPAPLTSRILIYIHKNIEFEKV